MIRHIVRKELLVNLLSLRFVIGLVVAVLMMGLVGYILTEDYAARNQTYLSDVQEHQRAVEQTKVYSMLEVVADIPPSPISVFSRGTKDFPTSIRISPYHIPSLIDESGGSANISLAGASNRRYNPLLKVFTSIDLSFVIVMILSLLAILLVFDSFSGEREQGTLKLALSSSIGRVQLLAGKFLGALVTLAIPLTLGFLEIILLWSLSPKVSLDASNWIGIALVYLSSFAFLSGFLALGLFVSLFAKESSSGLTYLLLAWVVVAIVIPAGGEYLAEYFRPEEIRETVLREAEQAAREFSKSYSSLDYHPKSDWDNANWTIFGGESLLGITKEEVYNRVEFNKKAFPMKFRFAEERYRVVENYAGALRTWSRLRDNLMRPSLCVLYRNIVQAIAGTDIRSFEAVVQRARFYREALMAYLRPKVGTPELFTRALEYPDVQPTDENRKYWQDLIDKKGERAVEKILSWDRVAPLDLSMMPPPHVGFSGLGQRIRNVVGDGLLLVGAIALFLILAIWRVLHYPIG
jgi:ABC-type transport system involved in multi-copper enzyme maturation permease subunit